MQYFISLVQHVEESSRPFHFSEDILIRFMKGRHILYPTLSSIFLYYPGKKSAFEICACLGISDLSITPLLEFKRDVLKLAQDKIALLECSRIVLKVDCYYKN